MAAQADEWLRRRQAWVSFALLSLRFLAALPQWGTSARSLAGSAAAALLGGCLWWVAKRQINPGAGLFALLLYLVSPVWHAGLDSAAALGLFVLLFTAEGVAHAVQGPRRKWGPRLVLLAAAILATGLAQPSAAWTGLALGFACMLYLGEGRRRLLTGIAAAGAVLAMAATGLHPVLASLVPGVFSTIAAPSAALFLGDIPAIAAALVLWVLSRRSRFFGNTWPLLAGVVCLAAPGNPHLPWALPLMLLFIAGVFADGMSSRRPHLWKAAAAACVLLQSAACLSKLPFPRP